MKIASGHVDTALKNALPLAIGAVLLIALVYYLARKTLSDAAGAVGGVISGDNLLTQGTPYQATGIAGTLGAAANVVSGGSLQAIGEAVSSWFSPSYDDDGLFYITLFSDGQRHSVPGSTVDKDGYFTYQGKRYRLGYNNGNQRVAVAA
jgi:hypothetical protein